MRATDWGPLLIIVWTHLSVVGLYVYALQWLFLFFRLLAVCLSLIILIMIQAGKANQILLMIGCLLAPVGYVLDHMQNYVVQHQYIGIFGETEVLFITIAFLGFEVCFGMHIMDIKVI